MLSHTSQIHKGNLKIFDSRPFSSFFNHKTENQFNRLFSSTQNFQACSKILIYDDELQLLKNKASNNNLNDLKNYAKKCLQNPKYFHEGLIALKKCADFNDDESAEMYALLSLLQNNFNISSGFTYAERATSARIKAIWNLFFESSEAAKQTLTDLADNKNDPISSSVLLFYDFYTKGNSDRVYPMLNLLSGSKIAEPWRSFLLIGIGKLLFGYEKLDDSLKFLQKAYEIGNQSDDILFFVAFLRFYEKNDDRKVVFNLVKKSYENSLDTDRCNITQKYAYMLLVGDGCTKDPKKSVNILEKKNNKSNEDMIILAISLIECNRITEGFNILSSVAKHYNIIAQTVFGFYSFYLENKQYEAEAINFLQEAAENGSQNAEHILTKLKKNEKLNIKDLYLPVFQPREEN